MPLSKAAPPYVPTLTHVVRQPERRSAPAIDPEQVVAQVMQKLAPVLEASVRQAVAQVLSEIEASQASAGLKGGLE